MRSQFCFHMREKDEEEFARFVLSESGIVFVHSVNWPTAEPVVVKSLEGIDDYAQVLIWCPAESPGLSAERVESEHGAAHAEGHCAGVMGDVSRASIWRRPQALTLE